MWPPQALGSTSFYINCIGYKILYIRVMFTLADPSLTCQAIDYYEFWIVNGQYRILYNLTYILCDTVLTLSTSCPPADKK